MAWSSGFIKGRPRFRNCSTVVANYCCSFVLLERQIPFHDFIGKGFEVSIKCSLISIRKVEVPSCRHFVISPTRGLSPQTISLKIVYTEYGEIMAEGASLLIIIIQHNIIWSYSLNLICTYTQYPRTPIDTSLALKGLP